MVYQRNNGDSSKPANKGAGAIFPIYGISLDGLSHKLYKIRIGLFISGIARQHVRDDKRDDFSWMGMNRRAFLLKSLGWAAAAACGSPLAEAMAMGQRPAPARLAIIIDDIGSSRRRASLFMAIQARLTYAVLPHLPYSADLAAALHARGHEILLHQPMEPYDRRLDPGPGALFVGDPPARIAQVVHANVQAVPHAAGVNNHMGSRFTSDGAHIRCALRAIQDHRLFFVDSLTTCHSKAYRTACGMQMTSGRRNVFLDTDRRPQAILNALYGVMHHALMRGEAIAIGHPYPETAAALALFHSEIQGTPIRIVPVSHLLAARS